VDTAKKIKKRVLEESNPEKKTVTLGPIVAGATAVAVVGAAWWLAGTFELVARTETTKGQLDLNKLDRGLRRWWVWRVDDGISKKFFTESAARAYYDSLARKG
jgi:hypothetical protein